MQLLLIRARVTESIECIENESDCMPKINSKLCQQEAKHMRWGNKHGKDSYNNNPQ